jgi:hypothetical protein
MLKLWTTESTGAVTLMGAPPRVPVIGRLSPVSPKSLKWKNSTPTPSQGRSSKKYATRAP